MKHLILLSALAMTGCATTAPTEVKIPVSVPCAVTAPDRPTWATDALARDADLYTQVKALLAERLQRIAYEAELEAAVKACQP